MTFGENQCKKQVFQVLAVLSVDFWLESGKICKNNHHTCLFHTRRLSHVFPIDISLCETCDPRGRPILWPQGHYLNKLGRGSLDDATYQISRL